MRRVLRARTKATGATAATAALVALAVAGCTGGSGSDDDADDPSTPSETSTSAGPTDDATETAVEPPELPAEAQEQTQGGSASFARHYIDLINFAQSTGDAEPLRDASDPSCTVCAAYGDAADEAWGDGGSVEGGEFALRELRDLPADYQAHYGHYAVIDVAEQRRVAASGDVVVAEPVEYRIGLYPAWQEDAWVMLWVAVPDPA